MVAVMHLNASARTEGYEALSLRVKATGLTLGRICDQPTPKSFLW